jgi:drug/metabolite transporter (DMT)-like permease
MSYLVITILMNVIISAIFKLFPRYDINALQAIVVNYIVCVITGCLYIGRIPFNAANTQASWFPWSLGLGLVFIGMFRLLAYNTQHYGITTTTIANKLSLVIPVLFSVFLYNEQAGIGKVLGILLAFPAVYFASREKADGGNVRHNLFWPAVLFIGSGLLDTSLKYAQHHCLTSPDDHAVFSIHIFGVAAITGIVITIVSLLQKKPIAWRNVVAGICVGIPNYFSIYFLIRTLDCGIMQSSAAIPVINIGILVVSSIVAILFFKERANPLRITGLVLAIIAILLITMGD